MSHATLVNDGLFWFVIFLTLLMMMFIYAVIATLCRSNTRLDS
jgi:hypothetical protein